MFFPHLKFFSISKVPHHENRIQYLRQDERVDDMPAEDDSFLSTRHDG